MVDGYFRCAVSDLCLGGVLCNMRVVQEIKQGKIKGGGEMVSRIIAVVILSGVTFAGVGFANEEAAPALNEEMAPVVNQDKVQELVMVDNKICPITGEKIITGKEAKVEYNGKVYNLCCAMCEKDFKKDPEAAIKKLEAGMKASPEGSMEMHPEENKASN